MRCEDHDWEARYCDQCGKYQGDECNHCGEWSDGGDHMAAQPELWCMCTVPLDELEREEEWCPECGGYHA